MNGASTTVATLKAVVDAVNAVLAAEVPHLTTGIGGDEQWRSGIFPRIIWIPSMDTFGPPNPSGIEPRALRTRFVGFDVHLWAEVVSAEDPLTPCEKLLAQLIWALHQVVGPAGYRLGDGGFVGLKEGGDLTQFGRAYLLHLAIEVPLVQTPGAYLVTVTSTPNPSTEMTFPDGSTAGPATPAP